MDHIGLKNGPVSGQCLWPYDMVSHGFSPPLQESGFQGRQEIFAARSKSPATQNAIDAVLEVLAVSHTVVSTKDRSGKMKYEALVVVVGLTKSFFFFWKGLRVNEKPKKSPKCCWNAK